MWLSVLGPLSVRGDNGEVAIPAAKQRVVLAALLVHANRVVSFDELAAVVWEGAPPPTARATLRNYVKWLRRLLGPAVAERIITRDPGYLVRLGADELDSLRLRALCDEGGAALRRADWQRAAAVLADALSLWRGTPLADIPSETLRRDAAVPLDRLRLQAAEWRVDADLHLGRHPSLVLELQELTAEQPLHERFHAQLMLALYRCGRAAEALAVYEQARQLLADRLGADPGSDLRQLHERILRADPALVPAPAVSPPATQPPPTGPRPLPAPPRQLPAVPGHFAGRSNELAALASLLDAPGGDGMVTIAAISGTAGVGKTALALRFAHQVADRFPDGQLYLNLRGFHPDSPPVTPAGAIRDLLHAVGVEPGRVPADLPAQAALYRSLAAGRRLLIVLDNARDAGQVRPLLPGGDGCLVLVTSRTQLTGLVASEGARPFVLDLLSEDDARELLDLRLDTERTRCDPSAVGDLIRLCARLPLALSIVAARAAIRPAFPLAALAAELRDTRGRLDGLDTGDAASSVRAVFSWSYERVSPAAGRMFRLLGVHAGPDISAPAAASLAGEPLAAACRALEELTRAHLIAEQVPGRFAFHDLLRAYAAEQAATYDGAAERRAAIRRVLDHYLHSAHGADRLLTPARDPITLDDPAPGAGREVLADCGQALAWFEREQPVLLAAVDQAVDNGFGVHTWQLAWALATFLDRRGHWADWTASQSVALAAALRAGDELGQAHAHRQLGHVRISAGAYAEADSHLWRAIELFRRVGDHVSEARTRLDIARTLEGQGLHRDAIGHATRALSLFRAVGHKTGQARALNGLGWCHAQLGEYQHTLTNCQQALDLHRELGYRNGESATLDSLGYAHHHLGHYAEAIECYRRSAGLARNEGDRYGEADALNHLGDVHWGVGDPATARDLWRQALAILAQLRHPDADKVAAKLGRLDPGMMRAETGAASAESAA